MGPGGGQSLVLGALSERVTLLEARTGGDVVRDFPRAGGGPGRGAEGGQDGAGMGVGEDSDPSSAKGEGGEAVHSPPARHPETIREKWKRLSRAFYSRETPAAREFHRLSSALAAQSPPSSPASSASVPTSASVRSPPAAPTFTRTVSAPGARQSVATKSAFMLERNGRSMILPLSHSTQPMLPSSASARREVVIASDEWLATSKKTYRAVLELYKRVRKRNPTVVTSDLEGRLQRLDALHQKQLLAVAMLDERCNVLLNSYNTAIRSIACKLLQWDSTLSSWEEAINKMTPLKKDESG